MPNWVDSGIITVIMRDRQFAENQIALKKPSRYDLPMESITALHQLSALLPIDTVCVKLRQGAMKPILTAVGLCCCVQWILVLEVFNSI